MAFGFERLADLARAAVGRERALLERRANQLRGETLGRMLQERTRLESAARQLSSGTSAVLRTATQRLESAGRRLTAGTAAAIRGDRHRLDNAALQLGRGARTRLRSEQNRLEHFETKQRLLDPSRVLARGYAIVHSEDGKVATGIEGLATGSKVTINFRDGTAAASIESTRPKPTDTH